MAKGVSCYQRAMKEKQAAIEDKNTEVKQLNDKLERLCAHRRVVVNALLKTQAELDVSFPPCCLCASFFTDT